MLTLARPGHRLRAGIAWKVGAASLALIVVTGVIASPWLDVVIGSASFTLVAVVTRAIPSELVDAFRYSVRRGQQRS